MFATQSWTESLRNPRSTREKQSTGFTLIKAVLHEAIFTATWNAISDIRAYMLSKK